MAATNTTNPYLTVKITMKDRASNPPGKLADAELHFIGGTLAGTKLIGFAVWERRTGDGRNVTFPHASTASMASAAASRSYGRLRTRRRQRQFAI
jgi:hypothetical protein